MSHYWINDDNQQNSWYSSEANIGWGQYNNSQQQSSIPQGSSYYDSYQQQQAQNTNFYSGQYFIPSQLQALPTDDFENESPLLEELGINFSHIRQKTFAVLNPVGSVAPDVIADQDLAGPLVFCLLFGAALLLHGKIQFGYIYGIGALGCVGMYALLNLMAADNSISLTCTASVLGYCLLPMAILSMIAAIFSFQGVLGYLIASAAVIWCSVASSKLFITTLSLDGQRLLVAYPCALLYCVFALLAIF
uniref:Protein YIPF n=1 Tax=Elaeophora elaphi TaxID=1147741 RepID=A0A0R3RS28_9BILA